MRTPPTMGAACTMHQDYSHLVIHRSQHRNTLCNLAVAHRVNSIILNACRHKGAMRELALILACKLLSDSRKDLVSP